MRKQILSEIKKIADRLDVKLKDIVFHDHSDIVYLEDDKVLKKSVEQWIDVNWKFENNVLKTTVTIPDNYVSDIPLQFCFYLKWKETLQKIETVFNVWKNANVRVFSNCMTVESVWRHEDMKTFHLGEGSRLETYELHLNTKRSASKTNTTSKVYIGENAYFSNEFVATVWNIWNLNKSIYVYLEWDSSKTDLLSRINLKKDDHANSYNEILITWKEAKAILKSKSVSSEWSSNKFVWKMIWEWDKCIWHIDCEEVLLWKGDVQSMPELKVNNPSARLTHEASLWSIEKSAIDNLRAKWLTEEEATDFIVKWVLDNNN